MEKMISNEDVSRIIQMNAAIVEANCVILKLLSLPMVHEDPAKAGAGPGRLLHPIKLEPGQKVTY